MPKVLSVCLRVVESAARPKLVYGLQVQGEASFQLDSAKVYHTAIASCGPGNIIMGLRHSGNPYYLLRSLEEQTNIS